MNNTERDILLKTFGSLPEDKDGQKLTGVTFGIPKLGDVRLSLHGTWLEMKSETITTSRPIAVFEGIAKPTTLEDLVGEDGQKNVWVHYRSGTKEQVLCGETSRGLAFCTKQNEKIGTGLATWAKGGFRWSHSPFTTYAEANEFVV